MSFISGVQISYGCFELLHFEFYEFSLLLNVYIQNTCMLRVNLLC
jgi:hypothetical protein